MGAEYALAHFLAKQRKKFWVINPDPCPKRYSFLNPEQKFFKQANDISLLPASIDLWIILDTNDPSRVGGLWGEIGPRAKKTVFLDHHSDWAHRTKSYPKHTLVVSDTRSSSIGELLYQLFKKAAPKSLDSKIMLGLYVSVMTDTNSFRYARTTLLAHEIAGLAIAKGVNPEEVYQSIYSSKELTHLKLLGHMLQNAKVSKEGRIAWLEVDLKLRGDHYASSDDTLSFLNLLLLLKDSEIVVLFREEENGRIRVSMKSKGKIVINQLAIEYGGGGHDFAAGMSVPGLLPEVVGQVIGRLEKEVKSA